tara:strand:+ start:1639 stop:2061 length:423 start_codon:yes stop_codon:yes gene_type:complete
MTQVPKIYAPTPAQSIAVSRGMPVSKVASLDASITESNASNPSAFETEFALHKDFQHNAGADDTRNQNLPRHSGRLAVPTQVFSFLVDQFSGANTDDYQPEHQARRIGSITTNAIKTYETNSKVIHRNPDVTGIELSIRL